MSDLSISQETLEHLENFKSLWLSKDEDAKKMAMSMQLDLEMTVEQFFEWFTEDKIFEIAGVPDWDRYIGDIPRDLDYRDLERLADQTENSITDIYDESDRNKVESIFSDVQHEIFQLINASENHNKILNFLSDNVDWLMRCALKDSPEDVYYMNDKVSKFWGKVSRFLSL